MLVEGGEDRVRTVVYMEHPLHRTNTAGFRCRNHLHLHLHLHLQGGCGGGEFLGGGGAGEEDGE